jgi:triosephosphate isomerase
MTDPRRPLITANWKMNGTRRAVATYFATLRRLLDDAGSRRCDIAVCPPATLIQASAEAASGTAIMIGGQDCHTMASGAHTGDIAAEMIRDVGGRLVIVGHSERRADHGETDALVREKAAAAHRAGLVAVICVGETEAERDAGRTLTVVGEQVVGSVPQDGSAGNVLIAYEPVWAIGSGRTPAAVEIEAVHGCVREVLRNLMADGDGVRILYGGSVKPGNAAEVLAIGDVDGALVGGASLDAGDFFAIIDSCP